MAKTIMPSALCSELDAAYSHKLSEFIIISSLLIRVAPDIISGPGRIWPPDMRPDMRSDASASLCNCAGIHCFTNSVICTSLFHHGHVDHTHILVSVCISLLVTYLVTLCDVA